MSSYKFKYEGCNVEIERQEGGRTAIFIDQAFRAALACPEEIAMQIIDADKKSQTLNG